MTVFLPSGCPERHGRHRREVCVWLTEFMSTWSDPTFPAVFWSVLRIPARVRRIRSIPLGWTTCDQNVGIYFEMVSFEWRASVLSSWKINTPAICLSSPSVFLEILILAFVAARGTEKIGNRFLSDGSKSMSILITPKTISSRWVHNGYPKIHRRRRPHHNHDPLLQAYSVAVIVIVLLVKMSLLLLLLLFLLLSCAI